MENTKVTLNDLEAYVSKLEAFVQTLDTEGRALTQKARHAIDTQKGLQTTTTR